MAIHTSRHQQILPSIFSVRIHPSLLSRSQGSESWCHTALWQKKHTKNNGYKKTTSLYRYEWEQMMHKYDNIPTQLFPSLHASSSSFLHPRFQTIWYSKVYDIPDIWLIDTQTESRCCNNQGDFISRPVHQDRLFVSLGRVFSSICSCLDFSMLVERCSKVDNRLFAVNIYDSCGIANFCCYLLNKWLPVGIYNKNTV